MKRIIVKNSEGKEWINIRLNFWMALAMFCVIDFILIMLIVGFIYKWRVEIKEER